jgi:N-methylhydantoinase A/oxoprolinase/acetone carboxylase beta subunit/N-methylhydantoinase B/oxoprolinase/acetone carboxylase alpha subunit
VLEAVRLSAEEVGLSRRELLARTDLFVHGTTVATNALLTRTGARTGLITTRGHEDSIVIGRAHAQVAGLVEREIVRSARLRKPEPIVPRELIRGVNERVDRDGDVVVTLDEGDVVAAIDGLVAAGVEAIAVSLLWSFANTAHERRIGELLAERGGGVVTAFSHEVAPVLGEYERTATTAINAYVGPKVIGYLEHLEARLEGEGLARPMLVMQAGGGLTSVRDAAQRPIVTLDSGPAGGVLGCRHLGDLYGEGNVICTDVGGTSFDVGLILDGEVEHEDDPVVGQFALRMPKVLVQSIGAGGGSIGWVDDGGLLRVGPQSAGSSPGPACYGLGGTEATVTDADLVLGYLDPDAFLGGRMRLDRDLALEALGRLGAKLGMEAEEVAVGMFRIINSQMADLIRRSTIERGHDPRDCVLVAYGGAGPTHAAFYGNDIGTKEILVLADSTVFSAEGMLTCDVAHTAETSRRVTFPLADEDLVGIDGRLRALQERVLAQFALEGASADEVVLTRAVGMRFHQQMHTVEVELEAGSLTADSAGRLFERFLERYARLYGSGALLTHGGVELELHRVVGTRAVQPVDFDEHEPTGSDATVALKGRRLVHFEPHGFVETPVYEGALLRPGNSLAGPAIVERMGDSLAVPPGYAGVVDRYLTIRLTEDAASRPAGETLSAPEGAPLDPVTFEVIRHRLWAINDDQGRMAARMCGSFIVYEGHDFNAALTTADGRGLYCGIYIMQHGATIDEFVQRVLATWGQDQIREGDLFFTNDPWWGALHANDGILAMPIFSNGGIVAWSGIVMHDNDVGGPVPGSFVTGAHDRFGEAPLFPAIKLGEGFEPRPDLLAAVLRNSRTPEMNALNMHARVAALHTTSERIQSLIADYGLDTFLAAQEGIVDYVYRVVRSRLREIPDGSWYGQVYHEHDGTNDEAYRICCRLTKHGDRLTFDFTGTSPQAPGPINCARPAMEGAVLGVILTFLCFDLPWAIGAIRDLAEIVSEPGTLNNAISPAPVSIASATATLSTQDVVANVFAKMLLSSAAYRSEAQATWSPALCASLFIAMNPDGSPAVGGLTDAFGGGGGARTLADGIDSGGIFHSMASRVPNVETLENGVPALQVWRRELRDGGGPGRFRGGAALEFGSIPHKLSEPGLLNTLAAGVVMPAGRGLSGGWPGAACSNVVLRGSNVETLFARGTIPLSAAEIEAERVDPQQAKMLGVLAPDDFLIGVQASGAGYGDPLRRDPANVAADVGRRLVSEEHARDVYGVLLHDGAVAETETAEHRDLLRRRRLEEAVPVDPRHEPITADGGELLHPVSDTVEAVAVDGRQLLRCTVCHHVLCDYDSDHKRAAVVRELPLAALSPHNRLCSPEYVLREFYCPQCATALAADVQHASEPILDESVFFASSLAAASAP